MRSVQYHVAITPSGLIAEPDGGVGCFDLTPPGEHLDDYLQSLRAYDTILMGRGTYEFGLKLGVTDPYPWARCLVFSRSLRRPRNNLRYRRLCRELCPGFFWAPATTKGRPSPAWATPAARSSLDTRR